MTVIPQVVDTHGKLWGRAKPWGLSTHFCLFSVPDCKLHEHELLQEILDLTICKRETAQVSGRDQNTFKMLGFHWEGHKAIGHCRPSVASRCRGGISVTAKPVFPSLSMASHSTQLLMNMTDPVTHGCARCCLEEMQSDDHDGVCSPSCGGAISIQADLHIKQLEYSTDCPHLCCERPCDRYVGL